MKKVIFALTVLFCTMCTFEAQAQGLFTKKEYQGRKPRTEYMQGAIKEEAGKVVFNHTIDAAAVAGYTPEKAKEAIARWASLRYTPNTQRGEWRDVDYFKNFEYPTVNINDNGQVECQGDEELVFNSKALVRDATRFQYLLTITIGKDKVDITATNIYYTYNLSETTERIAAEDWITDSQAFSKKGKLLHGVAKFRIKTIDTFDEIFKEISDSLSF